MADDFKANARTTGTVAVGGSATGDIEKRNDVDWFAVELVAGRTYVIDLEGAPSGGGTLGNAMLRGLYDAEGQRIAGTRNDDGGKGADARLTFTATESGTHYIAARSSGPDTGTYTVRVTAADPDATAAGATDLGDLAALDRTRTHQDTVDGGPDGTDYYRFTLSEAQQVKLTLMRQDADADLHLEDADGTVLHSSTRGGTRNDGIDEMLEAGTYYVRVVAQEAGENAYKLRYSAEGPDTPVESTPQPQPRPPPQPVVPTSVSEPDGADFSAETSTLGRLAVGGAATGRIEVPGDRDWFAVELEAGKTYRIDLKGEQPGGGASLDPYLPGVRDADGNFIAWGNYGTVTGGVHHNSRAFFTPGEDATYHVVAAALDGHTGAYTVSVNEIVDDFPADTGTAGRVAVGGSATGEIEFARDVDWFAVELEAGKTYRIDLKGTPTGDGTLRDTALYGIYDAGRNFIGGTANDNSGEGTNSRVSFTAAETATHYVAASGHGNHTGAYTVSVTEVDDFAADTGTAGRVAVGGSATGEIEAARDRDWFAVELEAGKTYRIDLKGAPTGDGTWEDPYLHGIFGADGARVPGTRGDHDSGTGKNSRVSFTATETATYYVAVAGRGDHTGTYAVSVAEAPDEPAAAVGTAGRVAVTEVNADDFTADTGTAGRVAVGSAATGELETERDRDWFAVALEAGRTYRIDLKGASTGDGTLTHPSLSGIHDADGNLIPGVSDYDGGTGSNSRVLFTAAETATHYVAAVGYDIHTATDHTGTYTLSVAEVPDDFSADTGTAGRVAVGGSATGEIELPGDRDWFAIELEAGRTYRIDLKGAPTGDGTLRDTALYGIYDADGKFIDGTADDTGANSRVSFTAAETATHYVAASGHGNHTGAYTVSVTEVDDFTADSGTAGRVAVGGTATGEIEFRGDRDWFAVELEAGKTYRIDLKGAPTGDGTLADPLLYGMRDANGNHIRGTADRDGGEGANSQVRFTATETATHYVAAAGYDIHTATDHTGTYTLSVAEVPDDFSADTGTAGRVAVGGSATGEIELPGDRDWFAIELEAGRTYRIDLKGAPTGDGTLRDTALYGIYDADGKFIDGTADDTGANSRVLFTAAETATYHVAAGGSKHDANGHYRPASGTYTLSVAEVPDDFAADTGTAGRVAVGGSATGETEVARDVDWFAVELEAGKTYRIDLKGSPTGDGTLRDTTLYGIYDADGKFIGGTADDTGANSRVSFTAAETATHYVAASGHGNHTGAYTVSVTEVDDFTADSGTAGRVAVGGTATGEIEFRGDRDWFAVELEAGKTYRIDLKGASTGDGTLAHPSLYGIYDADGNRIPGVSNYDGGTGSNSRLLFTATETATQYVAAAGYDIHTHTHQTGTYTLSVAEVPDDFSADTGTAGRVAVGGSVTGEIEIARDVDWFAVELEAGKTYRIDLKGSPTGDGTLRDTALYGIYDADGNFIDGTADDTGANSRVLFTAAETATYHVAASGRGDHTGAYAVSATEVDDFTADTGTAGTVPVGGSITGEIEARYDRDWFAVELEAGKTYRIDLKGAPTGDGTLADPLLYGMRDANGNHIRGTADRDGGEGANSQMRFTATETATYYVAVAGRGDHTGTYAVSVAEAPDEPAAAVGTAGRVAVTEVNADDFTADTGTAGRVAVGSAATGKLETERDRDWFAVALEAGRTYRIDLKGASTGDGTLAHPSLLGIYDADGNRIPGVSDYDGGEGANSRVLFAAAETATYYVAAAGYDIHTRTHHTGTYTLTVAEVPEIPDDIKAGTGTSGTVAVTALPDDFSANTGTAGRVAVDGSATGEIDYEGDYDWFAVELEAGKTYQINLKGASANAGTLRDPHLGGIYDKHGNSVDSGNDDGGVGRASLLVFSATETATYYVAAGGRNADDGSHTRQTGTYAVSVTEINADDYTGDADTAGSVRVGGSAGGEIESGGDRDWFAVEMEAGRTYRIDLKGASTGDGTLADPVTGVFVDDGTGVCRSWNDNGGVGANGRSYYTALESAIHYVLAEGAHEGLTGTYTVSVEEVVDAL